MSAYAKVIADPFDAAPCGIPDEYEAQTVSIKLKASYTVSTNDNGSFALVISPVIDGGAGSNYSALASCTATTSNISAFTASDHPDAATHTANFYLWRPVSAGMRVFYLGAEATSAGVIGVGHNDALIATTGGIGTQFPTAIADWFDMSGVFSQSVTAMTEPSMVAVRNFDRPVFTGLSATSQTTNFPAMWVVGTNLPVSLASAVRVECVLNCEMIPYHGNALTSHMQNITPPSAATIISAHRQLGTVRTGTATELAKDVVMTSSLQKNKKKRSATLARRRARPAYKPYPKKYGNGGFIQPSKMARMSRRPRSGRRKRRRFGVA